MNEPIDVSLPRDRAGEFVVRLAEAIGARADASGVFAPPVTQNGTTVIPVARALWGLGGGSGTKQAENARPESGGGGGVPVRPAGYIVLRRGRAKYRRINAVPALLLAALAGAGLALALLRLDHSTVVPEGPRTPSGSGRRAR
jgi:uncharacterized spore protein YtfJ